MQDVRIGGCWRLVVPRWISAAVLTVSHVLLDAQPLGNLYVVTRFFDPVLMGVATLGVVAERPKAPPC